MQKDSDELEVETMLRVKKALRKVRVEEVKDVTRNILEQKVIHKKPKKELDDCRKANDFRMEDLRVMVSNVRGFYLKKESLEAILENTGEFPQFNGFSTFFRNRTDCGSGGVAVMVREE